jgi:3-hydroxybutyryl-CoA dehydratase
MEYADSIFIGQITRNQRTFSENDVKKWTVLTQDFNDVYQPGFRFELPLVPGILCEGLISEAINRELSGIVTVMLKKELVFLHPVHIGDTITVEIETINVNEQMNWITEKVSCVNESGNEVVKGQVVMKILSI